MIMKIILCGREDADIGETIESANYAHGTCDRGALFSIPCNIYSQL